MFGDPREMVLHYFLADDTIEIREIIRSNSGRDAVPMFLRRQKLPKVLYIYIKCDLQHGVFNKGPAVTTPLTETSSKLWNYILWNCFFLVIYIVLP